MTYLPENLLDDIRSNSSLVVDYFNTNRTQFIADLGLPAMDETALQAAWCAVVAYSLAPYGARSGNELSDLLAAPTLECTGYVALTWYLIEEFGLSTEDQAAIGWIDGAVGNHVQMLVSVNGTDLLLDPTIGLVAYGVTLEGLLSQTHYTAWASFYGRTDLDAFNQSVIDAVSDGLYHVRDTIYYAPSFDEFMTSPASVLGLTLDHGNDSQTIVGYINADTIDAGVGDDFVYGGRGNDTIIGGAGSDIIEGGAGLDRVTYSGSRADYVIANLGVQGYRVTGADGADRILGVETIQFTDETVDLPATPLIVLDTNDQFLWATETTTPDWYGNILSIEYEMDDGRSWLYQYDALDQFVWDRIQVISDPQGAITQVMYDQDDGSGVHYRYDTTNAGAWSSITSYFAANGATQRHLYNQDDGSRVLYEYDYNNAGAWAQITTYLDANWQVSRRLYQQDDNSQTLYEYDLGNAAWDRIVTYFSDTQRVTQRLYDQDNGTHLLYTYDVADTKVWSTAERHYRADWTPTKDVVHYDNGSHAVVHFDESGAITARYAYSADWLLIG